MAMQEEIVLKVRDLCKSYSGVEVLHNVSFDLRKAEIHCLCGENGAGKSTLIKAISGTIVFEKGKIELLGNEFSSLTPSVAKANGVQTIYQENHLVPYMTIAENIFIGQEIVNRAKMISKKETVRRARELIARYGLELDPTRLVKTLSVAEQQYVKILKALEKKSQILILDEPTSMFNLRDARLVLDLVKRIRGEGISIIYISHHLNEVKEIADRITVLKDGTVVDTIENINGSVNVSEIASKMVGRSVEAYYQRRTRKAPGETIFEVQGLRRKKDMPPISFSIRKGEILGMAGMVGSGRSEMARAIFGAERVYSGKILLSGREVRFNSPGEAISGGIAMTPEDRQKQGLSLGLSIGENLLLASVKRFAGFFYRVKTAIATQDSIIKYVGIKAHSPYLPVGSLSGGNQQKTVIGKWLNVEADVLILDEPTRGVDVNSKAEIYDIICDLADKGKAILLISSDMPELIALSDRIAIMRENQLAAEISGEEITEENIIVHMIGV